MRYVAAYLLAVSGGKENPSAKDLETIISAVGIETDLDKINMVISSLKGQNIEELVTKGMLQQRVEELIMRLGGDDNSSEEETENKTSLTNEQEEILYQDCGLGKLASMPTGKAVASAPAAATPVAAVQEKKEEKKPEKKEESDQSDDDMGFGLFD